MPATSTLFDLSALRQTVSRFAGRRIAVLGDLMLDRYVWGRVERISPEAPVPVVEIDRETIALGGAGNVAANLRALGAEPVLIAAVGDDAGGEELRSALAARGVDPRRIEIDRARPTTVKTRIIAHSQQVVRTDRESRADLAGAPLDRLLESLAVELPECAGLVVSDYGKGVIHEGPLDRALSLARGARIPVCVDPKESQIDRYRGVSILTPNQHEAGYVQGRRVVDEASLLEVGWGLQRRLDAEAVLVTRGAAGMSLFERGGRLTHLPTVAREVYDVTGAGDTVVSVVALGLAAGADFPHACYLSNHAAGLVIREVGTASCTREQLLASLAAAPA
ncbi:MAG TPA: D-glycero-beta-D-manno-heptose-7-phosphate kinase [Candidatus Eisenbacteria bacterium]|jgi:D-beta-D-heptose 7-phosphate kinase/D-beta-D-heptose 1-phosphate adenosyltransferase